MKLGAILGTAAAGAAGIAAGIGYEFVKEEKRLDKMEDKEKKFESFYRLLIAWVEVKQEGKNLSEYLKFNKIKSIAIYGMRELGQRFADELKDSDIEIKYIIDQNADTIDTDYLIYKPADNLESVDAVIVTAIYFYQDIEEELSKKMDCEIISLEDVIYGMI